MNRDKSYKRSDCRLCGSRELHLAIDYEPSVPVDNFRKSGHKNIALNSYEMSLYLCGDCGHAQLIDVVDPDILFGDYIYTSTSSPGLESHFKEFVSDVFTTIKLEPNDLVIDIGCNDGLLLSLIRELGCKTLGVDPSGFALRDAKQRGLEVYEAFLTQDVAKKISDKYGKASIVTATNVFSHADNMHEFLAGAANLLKDGGYFVFEVSYLKHLIISAVWDWVYHEHLAHHSIKPLVSFLALYGLSIVSVRELEVKGGSLRVVAIKDGAQNSPNIKIQEFIHREQLEGLYDHSTYIRLEQSKAKLKKLTGEIIDLFSREDIIASYGASATTTVLSQELGYATRINLLIDDNQARQKTLSPGYLIPVLSSEALDTIKPKMIILSAWRFSAPILVKCKEYIDNGGIVYIPLFVPQIITKNGAITLQTSADLQMLKKLMSKQI